MEALRTLISGHLPPAGEPVRAEVWPEADTPRFTGYDTQWLDSGTSALAHALMTARQLRPEVMSPEVIVPGYCCPDLVAAAIYAGVTVVIADIDVNDAGYDLQALEACLNERTLAVIAVNFLGVKERLVDIVQRLSPGTFLIEDNAQWFPDPAETDQLQGDFVVFSFGRGKPVSLLGGGLLLFKTAYEPALPVPAAATPERKALAHIKRSAYNWLLRPRFYQLLNRNPFIKLGQTRYQPLAHVHAMMPSQVQLIPANVQAHQTRSRSTEGAYDTFLQAHNQLQGLYCPRRGRLLRYPLLLNSRAQRDELLARLSRAGLGASAMYQQPLQKIAGLDGLLKRPQPCPNAQSFAERLLTLPVHSGVAEKHLHRIRLLIGAEVSEGSIRACARSH